MKNRKKETRKKSGGLNAEQLDQILEALNEIEWHFANEGIATLSDVAVGSGETEETADDDDDEEEEEEGSSSLPVFDAEEIEVAIDAFLSELINADIIKKDKHNRAPSFTDVFEDLFDEDQGLVKAARLFEDHVVGYFGWVSQEDMEKAYAYFVDIKDALTRARGSMGHE